jgi:site-specific recombinase XerD
MTHVFSIPHQSAISSSNSHARVNPDASLETARRRREFVRHLLENGIDLSRLKQALGRHTFSATEREWATRRTGDSIREAIEV